MSPNAPLYVIEGVAGNSEWMWTDQFESIFLNLIVDVTVLNITRA